jgi:hypothetical protein
MFLGPEVGSDLERLVGRARVEGLPIVGSDDCHRRDTEHAARTEDAERDLSSIRDEQLRDRHAWRLCAAGQDVLVQPEDVLRVVTVLEGDEPCVLLRPVHVAHALLRLVPEEVDVGATG